MILSKRCLLYPDLVVCQHESFRLARDVRTGMYNHLMNNIETGWRINVRGRAAVPGRRKASSYGTSITLLTCVWYAT